MSSSKKLDQAYADLGLTPIATIAEVKASYRKLSLKYHPDRNEGSKTAHDDFIRVSNAVQIITRHNQRNKEAFFAKESKESKEEDEEDEYTDEAAVDPDAVDEEDEYKDDDYEQEDMDDGYDECFEDEQMREMLAKMLFEKIFGRRGGRDYPEGLSLNIGSDGKLSFTFTAPDQQQEKGQRSMQWENDNDQTKAERAYEEKMQRKEQKRLAREQLDQRKKELMEEKARREEAERLAKADREQTERDAAAARSQQRTAAATVDRASTLVEQLKSRLTALKAVMESSRVAAAEGGGNSLSPRQSSSYAELSETVGSARDALEEKCSDGTSNLISQEVGRTALQNAYKRAAECLEKVDKEEAKKRQAKAEQLAKLEEEMRQQERAQRELAAAIEAARKEQERIRIAQQEKEREQALLREKEIRAEKEKKLLRERAEREKQEREKQEREREKQERERAERERAEKEAQRKRQEMKFVAGRELILQQHQWEQQQRRAAELKAQEEQSLRAIMEQQYQQQIAKDQREKQERRDEELARRMQREFDAEEALQATRPVVAPLPPFKFPGRSPSPESLPRPQFSPTEGETSTESLFARASDSSFCAAAATTTNTNTAAATSAVPVGVDSKSKTQRRSSRPASVPAPVVAPVAEKKKGGGKAISTTNTNKTKSRTTTKQQSKKGSSAAVAKTDFLSLPVIGILTCLLGLAVYFLTRTQA